MSSFTDPLIATDLPDGRRRRVHEPFTYFVGSENSSISYTVPAGFVTDGASHDNFAPDWKQGDEPRGMMTFTDAPVKLEDVKTADLAGIPPHIWWQKWICRIIGAKTFHWLMFVAKTEDNWIVSESLGKGTALTMFDNRKAFIYRIKGLPFEPMPMHLITIHAKYGDYPYDWGVSFKTGIWWLLKHYFGKVISVVKDKEVNCQEWVVLICAELGIEVLPPTEYPFSTNLEKSEMLEFVGEVN